MIKYPVGIQDFQEVIGGGYKYIDKTQYVYSLVETGKYYFLSRPRRFGKSLLVSTLDYLFQGKKELFEGLYISDKWNWEQTNPVIKISFANIGHKEIGLREAIYKRLQEIAKAYSINLESNSISLQFNELIIKLSERDGKVVVLIDEYDKPIIDYLGSDTSKAIENRDIFKSFYSILKDADPYLKMVFITGVSKFSRVSIFSDLNHLKDLTLSARYANCCGITEQELYTHFAEELEIYPKEKIKAWYNGYTWDLKTSVYNPFSLLNFFSDGTFKNYWFETATPTFLIELAKKNQLYDFSGAKIDEMDMSAYHIEKLEMLPLMFQTGYLTLREHDELSNIYTLDYPNLEVKRSFLSALVDSYIQSPLDKGVVLADNLRKALLNADIEKLQNLFNALFKSIPYSLWQKDNEAFYHAIIHLTFKILGIYVESEIQTSDGRMDALVKTEHYIYCFEFKLDESAEIALQQIKEKGYLLPYLHEQKKCFGIGINFSKELKKIESILWEEIHA